MLNITFEQCKVRTRYAYDLAAEAKQQATRSFNFGSGLGKNGDGTFPPERVARLYGDKMVAENRSSRIQLLWYDVLRIVENNGDLESAVRKMLEAEAEIALAILPPNPTDPKKAALWDAYRAILNGGKPVPATA